MQDHGQPDRSALVAFRMGIIASASKQMRHVVTGDDLRLAFSDALFACRWTESVIQNPYPIDVQFLG